MSDTLNSLQLGERPEGRTLMTASWVVGHKDGSHRLLKNGEVVFENGEILFVGHGFPGEVARRIDFGNALVSPGLIDLDALSDLDTTILGIDHHPGWAKGRVWPRSYVEAGPYEMYSAEELAFQKRFAFGQLLLNGITTAAPIASLFYRAWGRPWRSSRPPPMLPVNLAFAFISAPPSAPVAWCWKSRAVWFRFLMRSVVFRD